MQFHVFLESKEQCCYCKYWRIFKLISKWFIYIYIYILSICTLPKTNMERKNHLFGKETHLPNLHFWAPCQLNSPSIISRPGSRWMLRTNRKTTAWQIGGASGWHDASIPGIWSGPCNHWRLSSRRIKNLKKLIRIAHVWCGTSFILLAAAYCHLNSIP